MTPETFVCPKCGAEFASNRSLVGHQRKHTLKPKIKVECTLCGRICADNAALASHMTKHTAKRVDRNVRGHRKVGVLSGIEAV